MAKGKFIVFEGPEGSGKSSCLNYLRERFSNRNNVIFTREPGGTKVGEEIRAVLMDKNNKNMSVLTELFLFCAARAEHVENLIMPALESKNHVISDRFDASTVAYQIFGRNRHEFSEIFNRINYLAKSGLEPDLTIYLDVDPSVGILRKRKSADGLITRFDEEEMEFHTRVRRGFLQQYHESKRYKKNWRLIDTTRKKEKEVKGEVLKIITETLN